jgi:hypothetical protein
VFERTVNLGAEGTDVGTYTSVLREGGVIYGKGQGIVTTRDRHEMATWTGQVIGRFTGSGKISFLCIFPALQKKVSVLGPLTSKTLCPVILPLSSMISSPNAIVSSS